MAFEVGLPHSSTIGEQLGHDLAQESFATSRHAQIQIVVVLYIIMSYRHGVSRDIIESTVINKEDDIENI
jgi:hypothetical protein